ncbi:MAG TPA: hemerythrin domain-containing protein [Oleiagrimonas sp.]|nr:hemerythrin domain-containing protein [Oleiagrimonas sp.]
MMLTQQLLGQHQALRAALDEVRRLGPGTEQGQERLRQMRQLLIAHLHKEDAELYPELLRHPDTASLADRYAADMQGLARDILAFFDDFSSGGDAMEFARRYGRMRAQLIQRLTREELRLYPAWDAIQDK